MLIHFIAGIEDLHHECKVLRSVLWMLDRGVSKKCGWRGQANI